MPLVHNTNGTSLGKCGARCPAIARRCCAGVASKTASACAATASSPVARMPRSSLMPGRKIGFSAATETAATTSASRAHRTTSRPARRRTCANAVPQAPPPRMPNVCMKNYASRASPRAMKHGRRYPIKGARLFLAESLDTSLGDGFVLGGTRRSANADGADDLATDLDRQAATDDGRCTKREQVDIGLNMVLEDLRRPLEHCRSLGFLLRERDRAILRVVHALHHHHLAGRLDDIDRHRERRFLRLRFGGGHDLFRLRQRDRRTVRRRRRRRRRLLCLDDAGEKHRARKRGNQQTDLHRLFLPGFRYFFSLAMTAGLVE